MTTADRVEQVLNHVRPRHPDARALVPLRGTRAWDAWRRALRRERRGRQPTLADAGRRGRAVVVLDRLAATLSGPTLDPRLLRCFGDAGGAARARRRVLVLLGHLRPTLPLPIALDDYRRHAERGRRPRFSLGTLPRLCD
jgi:hypothetical protein